MVNQKTVGISDEPGIVLGLRTSRLNYAEAAAIEPLREPTRRATDQSTHLR